MIRTILRSVVMCVAMTLILQAQTAGPQGGNADARYSVFGPPRPAIWEVQLSRMNDEGAGISSFNFYRKDQRNKTIFFKASDNDLNNRSEFRVQEITGGIVLFPVGDDDRYQVDVGGTFDRIKDTALSEYAFFTRWTYRPQASLWFRVGYELFDGFAAGSRTNPYREISSAVLYAAAKGSLDPVSVVGVLGRGRITGVDNNRFGAGAFIEGPWNTFGFGGYIKSSAATEDVRTLAVGRWAPFRPDGLPSAIFIWKHRELYDFQIGGVFFGGSNLFVRPAAVGMTQGMFISSLALRENSELRQGQLMSITDDYRNADITLFYVYLNQGIEMIPGRINHVGFRAVQFFKMFNEVELALISKPVIGVFYNRETEPLYNPAVRSFTDAESSYWSFQTGVTIQQSLIANAIFAPSRTQWRIALSYVLR